MKSVLVLILLALLGCSRVEEFADTAPERDQEAAVDQDEKQLQTVLTTVRDAGSRAESITLYRVANELDAGYERIARTAKHKVVEYPVLEQVSLTREQAAPLVQLLSSRDAYLSPGDVWTCIFQPHHILQLAAGGTVVTLVICVECGDVQFWSAGDVETFKSVRPEANALLERLLAGLLRV